MRRTLNRPEEIAHRAIARYLDAVTMPHSTVWFTIPNQRGTRRRYEMGILKALGVKPGVPDICIVHAGRAVFIEVKAEGAYMSKAQKTMKAALNMAGAPVHVCRSIDDVRETLAEEGIPVRERMAA